MEGVCFVFKLFFISSKSLLQTQEHLDDAFIIHNFVCFNDLLLYIIAHSSVPSHQSDMNHTLITNTSLEVITHCNTMTNNAEPLTGSV